MISIKNISKSFSSKKILDNISFNIKKGQSVAIIGQSGAGKSVLLKHFNGLVIPDVGEIKINNETINKLSFSRLQKIRKVCDITFINDSKATNVDATDQALKNFNNIYWILGGRIKEKSLQKLKKHFFRIKHVFLVGETKFLYEKYLRNFLECTIVKNLAEAVKLSYFLAKEKIKKEKVKPSIILLSPACSSLDEWRDFEERGNAFIKIVKRI